MPGPANEFERRVDTGGGWPRRPRWLLSSWSAVLLALIILLNIWVSIARWSAGETFGAVLSAGLVVSLTGMLIALLRERRQQRQRGCRSSTLVE